MNKRSLADIHFILVNTTHAGNIGAAARAMKTMGCVSLRLVQPCHYLNNDALARASGADDIVRNATVHATLADALSDCTLVFGTSARDRSLEWSSVTAREAAARVYAQESPSRDICAIVFGRERSGLTNDELSLCSHRLWIPSDASFSSLNLGSAVQVVAYELRQAMLSRVKNQVNRTGELSGSPDMAESSQMPEESSDSGAMEQFFVHLEQTLVDIGFLDRENPRLLMRRLRRYFGRNRPEGSELNILRGILSAAQKSAGQTSRKPPRS